MSKKIRRFPCIKFKDRFPEDKLRIFSKGIVCLLFTKPMYVERLKNAGFYYYTADVVKCFDCDLKLTLLSSCDDFLDAHFHFSPDCKFLKKIKEQK
jgi:hypothetical protein